MVSPIRVGIRSFEVGVVDQVDRPPDNSCKLVLHVEQVGQRPACFLLKSSEEIDVAVGPKVVPEERTENVEFSNPPLTTELADRFVVYVDAVSCHRGAS